jgi:hypothetical protein
VQVQRWWCRAGNLAGGAGAGGAEVQRYRKCRGAEEGGAEEVDLCSGFAPMVQRCRDDSEFRGDAEVV